MIDKKPEHSKNWDFSQVDEYLFLGADLCCGVEHYEYLCNTMEIKADINLRKGETNRPSNLLEHYLWLPVEDKTAPSRSQLVVAAGMIDELIKGKKKVFVHCKNGHGRGPTVVAAYFILKQGMGVEEAIAKVAAARPEIHLEEVQKEVLRSLVN